MAELIISGEDGHGGEYRIAQGDIPWDYWGACKAIDDDAYLSAEHHDDSEGWREHLPATMRDFRSQATEIIGLQALSYFRHDQ